jgi:hypothetical protein
MKKLERARLTGTVLISTQTRQEHVVQRGGRRWCRFPGMGNALRSQAGASRTLLRQSNPSTAKATQAMFPDWAIKVVLRTQSHRVYER